MPILASEALLCENKKIQLQNVTPVRIEPNPLMNLWFQVQHSPFLAKWACATKGIFKLLLMHHLFLDFDDLVGINRAWLYKEPKVSVLQANAQLAQKGECWT